MFKSAKCAKSKVLESPEGHESALSSPGESWKSWGCQYTLEEVEVETRNQKWRFHPGGKLRK